MKEDLIRIVSEKIGGDASKVIEHLYSAGALPDSSVRMYLIGEMFFRIIADKKNARTANDVEEELAILFDVTPRWVRSTRSRYVRIGARMKRGPQKGK